MVETGIGDVKELKKTISTYLFDLEKGSRVKIIDVKNDGYDIMHEESGVKVLNCGFDIFFDE